MTTAEGALSVYAEVLNDAVGRAAADVLGAYNGPDRNLFTNRARQFALELAAHIELSPGPLVGNPWQDWLLDRILDDDNVVSRALERKPIADFGNLLRATAIAEFEVLRAWLAVEWPGILLDADLSPSPFDEGSLLPLPVDGPDSDRVETKRRLLEADPNEMLLVLADWYARGIGLFGRHKAFYWDGLALHGISRPDPIRLSTLVGYDREREPIINNTRQFVSGLPANDILVYGARGTGKSSTVKALLNEYADQGLRIVELSKQHLGTLPALLRALADRTRRFILFIDDLSFAEDEDDYKALKALLEGTLEARPTNVIVYATSNRRNLIVEKWSERATDDDVSPREKMEEKLSLVDRFGLRVAFPSPDQEKYLQIVESLASEMGLLLDPATLRQRAIQWELSHTGRSGRVARQFVVSLLGEVMLPAD